MTREEPCIFSMCMCVVPRVLLRTGWEGLGASGTTAAVPCLVLGVKVAIQILCRT